MWYHNFHCCPSCHEWVPKGLKVKHHANKLHCLVSVVLDQSQTMKTEQPRNAEQSELLQWSLWACSKSGTSHHVPTSALGLASFQSMIYSSACARAEWEMVLLVMKIRFDHIPDAAVLGPPEYCLDMRRSVSILRWSCLLSGTFKSMRKLFNSSSK